MTICELLPIISKSLAMIGLTLDIYGIFRLFKLEPTNLEEADEGRFESTFAPWSRDEKDKYIVSELNKNVRELKLKSQHLKREAKKFKNIIIIGFAMQISSIVLSFFYN
jgi:hypothetical protein